MQLQGAMHRSSLRKSTAYGVAKPHALWPLPGTAPTRCGRLHACRGSATVALAQTQLSAPWRPAHKSRPATKAAYSNDSSSSTAGSSSSSSSSGSSSEASSSSSGSAAQFGVFVCSGSPLVAEALAHTGVDWLCLDTQHGAVGYGELLRLLQATCSAPRRPQTIVRVGGPSDRFGIQQALDQGADGVMVPLVNSVAEAAEAVSYCRFPPQGCRSLVAPSRAILVQEGAGGAALGRYLQSANSRVQVWLQVESLQCLEALDAILDSVPGIDCLFVGPADLAVSMGLLGGPGPLAPQPPQPLQPQPAGGSSSDERSSGSSSEAAALPDLAAALAGPEMQEVHRRVIAACAARGVAAGCFCVGPARAKELAAMGYSRVGFDTDLGMLINSTSAALKSL